MSKLIKPGDSHPASHEPATLDSSVLELLACPACLCELRAEAERLSCAGCGRAYPIVDGIPVLIAERAE
jgi:uncharacterized protein YbaR (Trm112 family)